MTALHVALCFDDNFWAPAYAVMRSICLTTTRRADLHFHLLHTSLSPAHRADLETIASEYGATLQFHDLAASADFQAFVAGMPTSRQWPKIVYARLLLGDLLPPDAARVLYLDCDMMVRQPIEQLLETDLGGKMLGAVQEPNTPMITGKRDIRQNFDIFDTAAPYFNSGMLLIDLVQWRAFDIRNQIAAVNRRGIMGRLYYDQDLLNLVCAGRWQALDWRWNVIDANPAHEAMNPAILHYTGANKPWAIWAGILRTTAYARMYRHVMTNDIFYRFARHRRRRWWRRLLRLPS